jgi:glyoxylase-like metal-dependent hydrolase (beta-lactamase superfamily II)
MEKALRIETVVSAPFAENSYVVWREGSREAIVFDPGLEPELIFDVLKRENLNVAAILNTHGHADHIAGNGPMKAAYPGAPLVIGVNEQHMLLDAVANLSAPFGMPVTSPPADQVVKEGDVVDFASIRLEVYEIPGHSRGHVVFVYRDQPCIVFGGDVLFQGSIGRSDFPGGDGALLVKGIRTKLFCLPDDTVVHSGHGAATTIGNERRTNPFVGQ